MQGGIGGLRIQTDRVCLLLEGRGTAAWFWPAGRTASARGASQTVRPPRSLGLLRGHLVCSKDGGCISIKRASPSPPPAGQGDSASPVIVNRQARSLRTASLGGCTHTHHSVFPALANRPRLAPRLLPQLAVMNVTSGP